MAVHGLAVAAPMVVSKRSKHPKHVGKASIGLFTATPSKVPAGGGTVRLLTVVANATSCRFSSGRAVEALPSTKDCASGTASIKVRLPENAASSPRTYRFYLAAAGSAGASTAEPVAVVEGAAGSSAAPLITTQPASRDAVAGSSVTFTASASRATANVRWQVSTDAGRSWRAIVGATSRSYSFTASTGENGYEYRALFTLRGRTAVTSAVTLTVSAAGIAPVVTQQPSNQAVGAGDMVTFTAGASGSPAPGAQWQVSSDGGSTWANVSGATSGSYSLTAAVGENGFAYRAVFVNASGSATSAAATLTVSPANSAPTITLQPSNQGVLSGSGVTFTAGGSGSPTPSTQWQVSFDGGGSWADVVGANSTSYSFTPSDSQDGYEFRAVFTNLAGSATTDAAMLTVSASVRQPLVTLGPTSQTVFAGSPVTFSAAASGAPTPSVQWQLSTNGGGSWSPVPGATAGSYTFVATLGEDGYAYRAEFHNDGGTTDSFSATLTVDAAPTITLQPLSQSVASGSGVTFSAAASGNPAPSVQWQISTNGGSSWANLAGSTSTTYWLVATEAQNGYQYRAVFSNAGGVATTNAATVTVSPSQSAPAITSQPSSRAVVSGGGVTFSAAASGSPAPSVQWQVSTDGGVTWGDIAGATSPSYAFTSSGAENLFEYRAVFTNVVNSATTSAATLVVGSDARSGNWSGYVATGSKFSAVTGSWTVPFANCPAQSTSYSAAWIGIDGGVPGNNTVEQDGTDSDCSAGSPNYYAWYEMYGDPSVSNGYSVELSPITYPVRAGDAMSASVSLSGSTWVLAIADLSRGWSAPTSIPSPSFAPQQGTAEWIVETPTVGSQLAPLTDFGSVSFGGATADGNGHTGPISDFSSTATEMASGFSLMALPGPLNPGGGGFVDTWYAGS